MLSTYFYSLLRFTGITMTARQLRAGGAILCYHNVVPRATARGAPAMHLDVERFRMQIEWLVRHYTVIPLEELARRLRAGQPVRGVVSITCDDAYGGVFDLAWPFLHALGIPLTVFVPTGNGLDSGFWWDVQAVVEHTTPEERARWLSDFGGDARRIGRLLPASAEPPPPTYRRASWARIAQAARQGCDLGVHSSTHRNLTCLTDAELRDELSESRTTLRTRTGHNATSFSYPYGRFDARVRDAVHRAGYETAVTLDFGLNRAPADHLALRRINVPAPIGPAAFEAWIAGLRPRQGETV